MPKMVEAKGEHEFTVPAELVFDAWLRPESVKSWQSASLKSMGLKGDMRCVEIDARVGGKFTFSDMRDSGEAVHWGYYRELVRPHRLVFTRFTSAVDELDNTSLVNLSSKSTAKGCIVTVTHSIDARYAEYIPQTKKGWKTMLAQSGLIKNINYL